MLLTNKYIEVKPILQAEHLRRVGVFHLPPAVEEPDTDALFRSDRSAEDALQLAQLRTCLQFNPASMEKNSYHLLVTTI